MGSPPRLASVLAESGFPADEISAKLDLFAAAGEAFASLASGPPAGAWWVPGRIEVFGKHTDYAGGESLLAAVPRGFALVAAPRSDGRVRVTNAATAETMELEAGSGAPQPLEAEDGLGRGGGPGHGAGASPDRMEARHREGEAAGGGRPLPPGFGRYVRALTLRLAGNFPGAPLGADLAFASDLPQAAGLSSSSALTVGIASALVRFAGLEERPEWRAAIRTREDRAGYFACLENGADFGPLAGAPGVGALTGNEDPTAILGCRAGRLSRYSFLPGIHHGDVPFPADWRFVIAASGVVAEKAGNARERYNRAARGVAELLAIWNREEVGRGRPPAPSLAAALAGDPEAEAKLRTWIERCEVARKPGAGSAPSSREGARSGAREEPGDGLPRPEPGTVRSDLETRLTHFLRENPRSAQAAAAFGRADAAALGLLAAESQRDAEELLGNQVPETIALVELARVLGAFAASAFGGGFGGAVWALVAGGPGGGEARGFSGRWLAAYRARFPQHPLAEAFVAMPGPGLLEIAPPFILGSFRRA